MAHRNLPRPAAVYGIDIGKNLFQVSGLSCDGAPVQNVAFDGTPFFSSLLAHNQA